MTEDKTTQSAVMTARTKGQGGVAKDRGAEWEVAQRGFLVKLKGQLHIPEVMLRPPFGNNSPATQISV